MINDFLSKWVNFWVFLFCIGIISYSAMSAIVLLLTMSYIWLAKHDNHLNFALNKEEKVFVYFVLIWFFIQLFGIVYQPLGYEYENIRMQLSSFDNVSRWLLFLPIFFLLSRYIIDWRLVAIGTSIGVLISVAIAHNEVYFLNLGRSKGASVHIIPFGELMVIADLILSVLMFYAWSRKEKILSYFLLFASISAFYGSILSATRGAWLVYPLMILIWFFYVFKNSPFNKKYLLSKPILLKLLFTIILLFSVSQTKHYEVLESRINGTISALHEGNYQGASSSRLQIFKDSINHIKEYPFGIGTRNFEKIDPNGYPYNAHNQLLNVWVENGIQGLISLLLLIGFSLRFFWTNLNHTNKTIHTYASSGLLLILSYIVFSQSQVVFDHHQTLVFFIFYLYFFFAQIQALTKLN